MAQRPVTVRLPRFDEIIPPAARAALLRQIALLLIGRIKRRTRAGLDVNGKPFRAYSTSYARNRRRAGRETRPTLWLEGGMLNSMGILSSSADRAVIGFQGSAPATSFTYRTKTTKKKLLSQTQHTTKRVSVKSKRTGQSMDLTVKLGPGTVSNALKAYWNDAGDGPPRRHFFGLSQEDRLFATKYALRELTALAGRVYLQRAAGR